MQYTKALRAILLYCEAAILVVCGLTIAPPAAAEPAGAAQSSMRAITVTTSSDGMWTYISVSSAQKGAPLAAAYIVEYASAAKRRPQYSGQATINATNEALTVKPQKGSGWLFALSQSSRRASPGVAIIAGLAGIIQFETQSLTAVVRPISHADFVERAHALVLGIEKGGLGHCQCGGMGASACTLDGAASVTCSRGYFACCRDGACASVADSAGR